MSRTESGHQALKPTARRHLVSRSRARTGDPRRRQARAHARLCAVTGLAFTGLFVAALVLVKQAPGLTSPDAHYSDFYSAGSGNVLVTVGLHLVPFAGIAFLWHLSATRALLEARPGDSSAIPRFLQLASGLLFLCMVFAGTAAVGAVALLTVFSATPLPPPEVARALTGVGYGMVFVFGVRAAGMYIMTTTTLTSHSGLMPRPVALVSYLAATFLLVSTTFHPAVMLVFPAWVLLLSIVLLVRGAAGSGSPDATPRP